MWIKVSDGVHDHVLFHFEILRLKLTKAKTDFSIISLEVLSNDITVETMTPHVREIHVYHWAQYDLV